jgi:hypothetical protein
MCNATAVYLVSELLSGRSPGTELGLVVLFSIPYGGVPGVVYAAPMGAAVLAARAADGRDDSSALRPLAAVLGVVGILALVVARTASTRYALWPVVVGTGTAVAFVCLAQAAVDLVAALEVHNAARGRAPDLAVVAPFGSVWYLCRIAAEGEGPYRTADVTHPIRRLDRAPARWIRARILGATGLAALAVAVGVLVG